MKRRELLKHLNDHGCHLVREGSSHSIWGNSKTKNRTSIPRHREVNDYTAKKICQQLGIPAPF